MRRNPPPKGSDDRIAFFSRGKRDDVGEAGMSSWCGWMMFGRRRRWVFPWWFPTHIITSCVSLEVDSICVVNEFVSSTLYEAFCWSLLFCSLYATKRSILRMLCHGISFEVSPFASSLILWVCTTCIDNVILLMEGILHHLGYV